MAPLRHPGSQKACGTPPANSHSVEKFFQPGANGWPASRRLDLAWLTEPCRRRVGVATITAPHDLVRSRCSCVISGWVREACRCRVRSDRAESLPLILRRAGIDGIPVGTRTERSLTAHWQYLAVSRPPSAQSCSHSDTPAKPVHVDPRFTAEADGDQLRSFGKQTTAASVISRHSSDQAATDGNAGSRPLPPSGPTRPLHRAWRSGCAPAERPSRCHRLSRVSPAKGQAEAAHACPKAAPGLASPGPAGAVMTASRILPGDPELGGIQVAPGPWNTDSQKK